MLYVIAFNCCVITLAWIYHKLRVRTPVDGLLGSSLLKTTRSIFLYILIV